MSYIDELRERFEAAEQRFGRINEAGREYRDRLMGLMSRIEEEIRCRRDVEQQQAKEIERLSGEVDRISGENEQLRTMMMSLLTAVESGDNDSLGGTLNEMDTKVAALIGEGQGSAAVEAPAEDAADPTTELADDSAEDSTEDSDDEEPFTVPSFSAGDMMSLPDDEPPFSGEDADLDHGGETASEESAEMAAAEETAAEEIVDETPAEEADAEAETSEGAESSDDGGSVPSGAQAEATSDMAEFFGADDRADDGAVPDYSHAVAGWEDFLDDDESSSGAAASSDETTEALAEVSDDFVGAEAGDPEAGSIHDLIDRVKTEVDGESADDAAGLDDASGEDDDDSGKAAAQ